ncbi:uncharacterized protein LOC116325117 [Oreochromis aureus]|uniref:uncharacterized protein LOC116325117 n=1 Tax=Oreochromis aureus TaxID=47969 RepID=UPI0012BC5A0D|nr:uncharacterized protein LOC116325117 [Oreochromis aureus]
MEKKVPSNTNLQTRNTDLHNDTVTLVTLNVTAENSGQYICMAKHLDKTLTSYVNVTVTWHTKIQNGSGCVLQSEVLTCVCISEGFPLPTIKWPLLENHTQYILITTVSNHTVNSTVSLTVKNHGNSTVECVSNNGHVEEREILLVQENLSEKHAARVKHCGSYSTVLPWIVAGVSLTLNTFCITYIWFLWNSRKKSNLHQEDRTYMSLQKVDVSPDYDVIAQRIN